MRRRNDTGRGVVWAQRVPLTLPLRSAEQARVEQQLVHFVQTQLSLSQRIQFQGTPAYVLIAWHLKRHGISFDQLQQAAERVLL